MTAKAPPGVDMSPEAIDRRFRELSQLYQFAVSLKDFKVLGPVKKSDGDERRNK